MSGAFEIGAIGLQSQQRALDVIANNITNVNTPAFKRSDVRFAEIIATRTASTALPADLAREAPQVAGVMADPQLMLNEQGRIEQTGRAMDIAIEGAGFIELMGPTGQTLLWRGGGLKINGDGLLAAGNGMALRAAITMPQDATAIEIGSDGIVRVLAAGEVEPVEVGQISLVRLDDAGAIERLDGGLYRVGETARLTEAPPGEDGVGLLVQGAMERSNVELTDEMVRLMLVQRSYAANAQVVQAADQLMAIANGLRR
ncbi:flagellar hook basal-body protein [Sphingomonas gilva]|uniref:Flagellar hook basal-body protein n=1 Tax=Sphingomonas gilva TaxID=2305907 RepID=A0A396RR22_9SPHN|nr:flagellar hook basal-body protein [Sphingomonas gilva]RHW18968.1 flagellar hook basal-body protein [Sphingomonas gilva]